jgi:tRNA pseudouridine65 synthase
MLEIIYEDAWLVAVNKPSGMLVHRGWARDGDIAVDVLHRQLGKHVWPLHRLDRATSGALLFALDLETTRTLSHEFEHGRVGKRYLALVRGIPPEELLIDHALRRVDSDKSSRPERLPAQTQIRRLATFERYALVEATPLTGRTHQIRRHLKHISHPIIGDVRYGKGDHNRWFRERFGLHRLALHASELHVPHPTLGQVLVRAPLPADLAGPLAAMGVTVSDGDSLS